MRDEAYLRKVRGLPCILRNASSCFGVTEADHVGADKGVAMKGSDHDAVPMCRNHHTQRHAMQGYFRGWDKALMAAWRKWAIAATRKRLAVTMTTTLEW